MCQPIDSVMAGSLAYLLLSLQPAPPLNVKTNCRKYFPPQLFTTSITECGLLIHMFTSLPPDNPASCGHVAITTGQLSTITLSGPTSQSSLSCTACPVHSTGLGPTTNFLDNILHDSSSQQLCNFFATPPHPIATNPESSNTVTHYYITASSMQFDIHNRQLMYRVYSTF